MLVFAIVFLATYISSGDIKTALLLATFIGLISGVATTIWDNLGVKKHKRIHTSKLFRDLISKGFQSESFGEYYGLIKKIESGTVRIFYDWNKTLKGPLSFGDIIIDIYYEPLDDPKDNASVNKVLIKSLNKKYEYSGLNRRRMFIYDRVLIHLNYYRWTKAEDVMQEIERAINTLHSEKIRQVDLEKLSPEQKKYYNEGGFMPHVDLVWKELESRINPNG